MSSPHRKHRGYQAPARVEGDELPDYLESAEYAALAERVEAFIESGDKTSGAIRRYIAAGAETERERQRLENRASDVIETLVSATKIEPYGLQWVKYRKFTGILPDAVRVHPELIGTQVQPVHYAGLNSLSFPTRMVTGRRDR